MPTDLTNQTADQPKRVYTSMVVRVVGSVGPGVIILNGGLTIPTLCKGVKIVSPTWRSIPPIKSQDRRWIFSIVVRVVGVSFRCGGLTNPTLSKKDKAVLCDIRFYRVVSALAAVCGFLDCRWVRQETHIQGTPVKTYLLGVASILKSISPDPSHSPPHGGEKDLFVAGGTVFHYP